MFKLCSRVLDMHASMHAALATLRKLPLLLPRWSPLAAAAALLCVALLGWSTSAGGGGGMPEDAAASLLGVVMPLSSCDVDFAEDSIREALRCAGAVAVAYATHLSDGTPEDLSYVAALRARLDGAAAAAGSQLLWVAIEWQPGLSSRFWVRYLRWAALPRLPPSVRAVLWLDSDEVLDAPRFRAWWAARGLAAVLHRGVPHKLANYVYFRETRFQAVQLEDSAVLCRREGLTVSQFFDNPHAEREMFAAGARRAVPGLDGAPIMHHYSWVRSKALMLQKVRSWGHKDDAGRDWVAAVEAEFEHPFTGRDIVHGDAYSYRTVEQPWIDGLRAARKAAGAKAVVRASAAGG